jgi:thymidylate synthase
MKTFEQQYRHLLKECLEHGHSKTCRGGGTQTSIYGKQVIIDLDKEFPLLTARQISFNIIATECLWILGGNTNLDFLHKNNVHIWDDFATKQGEVGRMYQWRNWLSGEQSFDQLKTVINEIKSNPESKRLIVSSWNVSDLDSMSLPPCPHIFQFIVEDDRLHMHLTQRAGDLILGVPYDVGVYALLTHMVAHVTNLKPGKLFYNLADAHIYKPHKQIATKILEQKTHQPPTLKILEKRMDIDEFTVKDFVILNYQPTMHLTAKPTVGPLFKTFYG